MIVEISTQGSVLSRDHEQFVVKNSEGKNEIPSEMVEAIIITSNSLISTQAIRLRLERNIQLVISDWSGRPVARLWASTQGRAVNIRRGQYFAEGTKLAFNISRELVLTKLRRQKYILQYLKSNRSHSTEELIHFRHCKHQ